MKLHKSFFGITLLILLLSSCSCAGEPKGIYYPALSSRFMEETLYRKNSSICYADVSYLYYNGELYTRSHAFTEYSKSALPLDSLLSEEICPVYGNLPLYWSDTQEKLAEHNITGTLYHVPGYKDSFRVCLYYEKPAQVDLGLGPTYHLYVFDRTNNITLHTGKDYYTDLFHFPADAALNSLSMDDETVSSFVDALLAAEFIDPASETLPEFHFDPDSTYFFQFTDSLGLTNSVAIFEDGYVVDPEDYNFILKLDPALCTAVIDRFHQPQWPGEYKYITYNYDKERNVRTEFNYELCITETDTHLNFDLRVTQTEVPVNPSGTPIDNLVITGPIESLSIAKEEAKDTLILSFVSQRFPDTAPELITHIELKKGLQEDTIFLRYAASEEELKQLEYIKLNRR